MRNSIRIALVLLALAAAAPAGAQQTVLYKIDGWGKLSNREDNKGIANSFQWMVNTGSGAPAPLGAGGGTQGKVNAGDATLSIPAGDAAIRFAQAAMRGQHLPMVLVEFALTKGNPNDPAPFAIRLSEVAVVSVLVGKSAQDGGPGVAEVRLYAQRVELYSSTQDPKTGKVYGASKAGFDARAGKAY